MNVSTDFRNIIPTEQPEMTSISHEGKRIKQEGDNSASAIGLEAAPQTSNTSPTDGGREVTSHPPTHDDIERMTNERVNNDPDYQELLAKQGELKAAEIDFAIVDGATVFGRDDGIVTTAELKAIIADPFQNDGAKAAAQRLLNNTSLWNELASGVKNDNDGRVGTNDISRLIEATKLALKGIKDDTRASINAELAPPPATQPGAIPPAATPGAGTSAAGATGTTPGTAPPSPESSVPKPPPSTLPGMEGASENMANTADYLQAQMLALANDAAANPQNATVDAQKIAMLQNKFQAITNMMNQLTQMLSNMSKMWSDVAMNSIRNLK